MWYHVIIWSIAYRNLPPNIIHAKVYHNWYIFIGENIFEGTMCNVTPSYFSPLNKSGKLTVFQNIFFQINCMVTSSCPSDAYMCQWIGSVLVQIMACQLFGAKPLSKPMLSYCQLDPKEQTSVKFQSKYKNFHSWKCIWKYRIWNGGHLVQGKMS